MSMWSSKILSMFRIHSKACASLHKRPTRIPLLYSPRVFHRWSNGLSSRLFSSERSRVSTDQISNPRLARLQSRLPKFLQRYTTSIVNAPVSHVASFLLLHEITAIVPLFVLAGFFHYTQWMPPFISEGKWVADGMQKFGNWFQKRGWLGKVGEDGKHLKKRGIWWGRGEGGVRMLVEVATAYALTKALLPLRLVFSVWATPWFARIAIIPTTNSFRKVFRRKPQVKVPQEKTHVKANTSSAKESAKVHETRRE